MRRLCYTSCVPINFQRALCVPILLVAAACSLPAARFDALAEQAGLVRAVVAGAGFAHLVYSAAAGADDRGPVWVYIEGDGTPWIDETIAADDPTPRTPVAMPAMIEGPRPAIFLGRPCYFGVGDVAAPPAAGRRCSPIWWTHRRFAPEVIESMAAALRRIVAANGWQRRPINLVGFSGGGTLAVLMAPRVPRLCAVVTLASPLDTDEWTRSRRYSTLEGSVNPASRPPLPVSVAQLHLRGALDRVVAADNGAEFRRRNPAAEFRTLPLAHGREWIAAWREILRDGDSRALKRCAQVNE